MVQLPKLILKHHALVLKIDFEPFEKEIQERIKHVDKTCDVSFLNIMQVWKIYAVSKRCWYIFILRSRFVFFCFFAKQISYFLVAALLPKVQKIDF